MYAPLYNGLIAYSQTKYPYHMPGHKLGTFGDLQALPLFKLDVTEANGLDNLYEAEGIIQEALEAMKIFYGSEDTIMLTNGSTAGILASILTLCKPGDKLIVARNCHHSVWHGMILAGVVPIYVKPFYDIESGLLTEMLPQTIEAAVAKHPDVKGALIVSPTYEGVVSDIKAIAQVLHKVDKYLIVDEAHGAHFGIDAYFPTSSVKQGADLVIQSMHKTLPTLTQSALLHRGTTRISFADVIKNLRMVQTSSPSYTMMAVMDYVRAYIEVHRETIKEAYIVPLEACRQKLLTMKHLKLYKGSTCYDKGKLIILTQDTCIDGYTLAQVLEENYRIVCEAALPEAVILMTTLADDATTLTRLQEALCAIDRTLNKKINNADTYNKQLCATLDALDEGLVVCPRETHFAEGVWQPLARCEGAISKENMMLYPPGIPVVCIGEVITGAHIRLIEKWQQHLKGIRCRQGQIQCHIVRR